MAAVLYARRILVLTVIIGINVIAICLAASINLLALYTVTQARANTTLAGQPLQGYNSSASAVCAIWLMVQVYAVNVLRATGPTFQFPAILYSEATVSRYAVVWNWLMGSDGLSQASLPS